MARLDEEAADLELRDLVRPQAALGARPPHHERRLALRKCRIIYGATRRIERNRTTFDPYESKGGAHLPAKSWRRRGATKHGEGREPTLMSRARYSLQFSREVAGHLMQSLSSTTMSSFPLA